MKKTILILLTTGLFAFAANAQDAPPTVPQKQDHRWVKKIEQKRKPKEKRS